MPDPARHTEFVRWQAGPCLFVVLNVPGSNNGQTPHISDRENRERAAMNTAWLLDAADTARRRGLAGLVVLLHADVRLHRTQWSDHRTDVLDRKLPFAWVRALLIQVVMTFPGTVLLLNGDRHRFINDHPFAKLATRHVGQNRWGVSTRLAQARLARFMRVQSFGWPFTSHHVVIEAQRRPAPPEADPGLEITVATRVLSDEPDN